MRNFAFVAILFIWTAFSRADAQAAQVQVVGCSGTDPTPALQPLGPGPLGLAKIYCLPIGSTNFPRSAPSVSPGGGLFLAFDDIHGLWLGALSGEVAPAHFEGRLTSVSAFETIPFEWFEDGRGVLGVRQQARRNGFARGPLRPTFFKPDGTAQSLPDLQIPAGPLDELHWVGGSGLALAMFGSRAGYHRPEHPDPEPTIAFVDARAGRVLQSMPFAALPGSPQYPRLLDFVSQVDGHGRAQALFKVAPNSWLLWPRGEKPRPLLEGLVGRTTRLTLAPDGRKVLLMRGLSASGVICEHDPHCPPPIPASGAFAELRDLSSGRLLWSLNGTARNFSSDYRPAISPEGRYALISMPAVSPFRTVALISMESGKILQQLPAPSTGGCALGFSQDGKSAWISGGNLVIIYRIE